MLLFKSRSPDDAEATGDEELPIKAALLFWHYKQAPKGVNQQDFEGLTILDGKHSVLRCFHCLGALVGE